MYGKAIFSVACVMCLIAGMASAQTMDNTTTDGSQPTREQTAPDSADNGGTMGTMEQPASYNGDKAGNSGTTTSGQQTSRHGAAMSRADNNDTAGPAARAGQADGGRIVGKLVDESGRIQGYVVVTGQSGTNAMNRYVVVPADDVVSMSSGASDRSSMDTARAGRDAARTAEATRRRNLLEMMYRQLQKQALQIQLLREQLIQQQLGKPDETGRADSGNANTGLNPLDQVAHVVVDRFGRVQAIVLESGVVLASDKWAGMARSRLDIGSRNTNTAESPGNTDGMAESGQRRRAIIIFRPEQ